MAAARALIFDCDGTLADTMPAHYRAWVATLAPLGATFTEEQFYAMGGWPTQRVAEWVVREHRMAVAAEVITREKEARFEQMLNTVEPVEAVMPGKGAAGSRWRWPRAACDGSARQFCVTWVASSGSTRSSVATTCRAISRPPISSSKRPAGSTSRPPNAWSMKTRSPASKRPRRQAWP